MRLARRLRPCAAGCGWENTAPASRGRASSEGGSSRETGRFWGVRGSTHVVPLELKSQLEVFVCFLRWSLWGGIWAEIREAPCAKWSGEHVHVCLHVTPPQQSSRRKLPSGGRCSTSSWGECACVTTPPTNPRLHLLPLGPGA